MTPAHAGTWYLRRTIEDANLQLGTASGLATIVADGRATMYVERVELLLASRSIQATRRYRFETTERGLRAEFADGRPFFDAPFSPDGRVHTHHLCGDDLYLGTLVLNPAGRWSTTWFVCGSKRLRIVTSYARAHAGEVPLAAARMRVR